ncbi:MAG: hypothetical protein COV07_01505 [Candidatus Vogelbacteria bacterium CG10_big_fil_rev_8_21_14_0_10_45_14]|uniref:Uncharacterized protein n=1 Tax=Candidatus Vogelbacteria bacterium CG10_big_fil_rev_8_21_14_0_10_45_14 TaxID=1975042 RepID=A0A2H0RKH4_9BACT|nr:MAG: hypothetical protein COV07_01505 [Candidatus Vogelbacteria bacterium CG10_big_fil_rev_8_21_14_0_10_45_14]
MEVGPKGKSFEDRIIDHFLDQYGESVEIDQEELGQEVKVRLLLGNTDRFSLQLDDVHVGKLVFQKPRAIAPSPVIMSIVSYDDSKENISCALTPDDYNKSVEGAVCSRKSLIDWVVFDDYVDELTDKIIEKLSTIHASKQATKH